MASLNPAIEDVFIAATKGAPFVMAANITTQPTNATMSIVPAMTFPKLLLNISKIEVFNGIDLKKWPERIFSILDIHGVTWVLFNPKLELLQEN